MRKVTPIGIVALCLLSLAVCAPAFAQDEYIQVYKFPEIEPEVTLKGGYGFVFDSGSRRAGKFRYLKDSPTVGAEIVAFPFPHRVYLELDYLNKNDFFVDTRYAYKDIILSRWLNNTVYHNLDNITLVDLGAAGSSPDVLRRDAGQQYWLRTGLNKVFLRFKTPDFPFHVYIDGRMVDKRGTVQNRFLGGSGYFNNMVRVSQKRDVDWDTTEITVGLNSHIGPLEADYSHREKRFDSGANSILTEAYGASAVRGAGTFPHSLVPDMESSTDTLKVHTSYTGRISASLTLSQSDSENRVSNAGADYVTIAGDVRWMPLTKLTFFFKYRHKERDASARTSLPVGYLGFSSYTAAVVSGVTIQPLMSYKTDTISGVVRYRALKNLTLHAGYKHKSTDRSDPEIWNVSPTTSENSVYVSATARLNSKLKLVGKYEFEHTSSPAYNIQPEDAHNGKLSLTWTPVERVTAFLSYVIKRGETDNLVLESTTTGDRDVKSDSVVGNLSFLVKDNLTVTTGYAYLRNSVEQDHIYGLTLPPQVVFNDIRYRDSAHNFSVSAAYSPMEQLKLGAGVSHTRSRSDFSPDTTGVASFSRLKVRETIYSASADCELPDDWDVALNYEFTDFDDRIEDPQNPTFADGEAHLLFVSLSKKW